MLLLLLLLRHQGPSVLTGSAREVVLRSPPGSPALSYKLAREDWRDYGGKFKAIYIPVRHIKVRI